MTSSITTTSSVCLIAGNTLPPAPPAPHQRNHNGLAVARKNETAPHIPLFFLLSQFLFTLQSNRVRTKTRAKTGRKNGGTSRGCHTAAESVKTPRKIVEHGYCHHQVSCHGLLLLFFSLVSSLLSLPSLLLSFSSQGANMIMQKS